MATSTSRTKSDTDTTPTTGPSTADAPKEQLHRPLRSDLTRNLLRSLTEIEANGIAQSQAAAANLANRLLLEAHDAGASDIHIEPHQNGSRLRLRIDGIVHDVIHLTKWQAKTIVNQFKAMANLDPIIRFSPKDARTTMPLAGNNSLDLRFAFAPCLNGETVTVRLLDLKRVGRGINELGLSLEQSQRLVERIDTVTGMLLIAGPTGVGKTTTVYALLDRLKNTNSTVITIEDPVEYHVDGITQIQVDEFHHVGFSEGVKATLRLDPDYVVIGEIRDKDSAHSAVSAAVTGRVILSTMHSRDAAGAVSALRNWGLTGHEIAEALSVVVAQRLVRILCPHCRAKSTPTATEKRWLKAMQLPVPSETWRPVGCEECRQFGFTGRTGIFEIWTLDEDDYSQILGHVDERALRRHLASKGHRTLVEDGYSKALTGLTTIDELRSVSGGAFPSQHLPAAPRKRRGRNRATANG